jgi:group I intron endonuclease
MKTGVYAIRNKVNQKRYVGSAAKSLERRWYFHRWELRRGEHNNGHLQAAWNKYGEKSFVFEVLERCKPELCVEKEQYWMDAFQSYDDEYGYNLAPKAGSVLGFRHSAKTKKRTAELSRRQMMAMTPEERSEKARDACKKRWAGHIKKVRIKLSKEEAYQRRLEANQRPERIAKITATLNQPEVRAKRSAALTGRKLSKEHRAKLAAVMNSQEVRERISKGILANTTKEQRSQKSRMSRVGFMAKTTPEQRREIGLKAAAGRWGKRAVAC